MCACPCRSSTNLAQLSVSNVRSRAPPYSDSYRIFSKEGAVLVSYTVLDKLVFHTYHVMTKFLVCPMFHKSTPGIAFVFAQQGTQLYATQAPTHDQLSDLSMLFLMPRCTHARMRNSVLISPTSIFDWLSNLLHVIRT